jgi:hypothetical protein
LDHVTFDWAYSVYGDSGEELPPDMPTPRGNPVCTTTFEEANLMHDLTTGRSCTGILHLVNQTPVEWFSKRQKTVETATYGSEFVAAHIATEQIMDLQYTLRMMGVPLDGKAYMFGDNQSVITSGTIPLPSTSAIIPWLITPFVKPLLLLLFGSFTLVERSIQLMSSPSSWDMLLSGHLSNPSFFGADSLHKLRPSLFSGMDSPLLYRVVKHISYRGECQLGPYSLLFMGWSVLCCASVLHLLIVLSRACLLEKVRFGISLWENFGQTID